MRPSPGDHAWHGRQRPADHDPAPLMASSCSSQMSFFLADESSIDSYLEHSNPHGRFLDARKAATSTSVPPPRGNDKDSEPSRQATMQRERDYIPAYSQSSRASVFTHSPASMRSQNYSSPSRPITPIMLGTSCTGSVISTPSSRRNSFAGSLSDHGVSSDEEFFEQRSSNTIDSGSAPQLVMPSIKMPSRRPFTEIGKNLGRLKVLFAGDSGIGKTSMVKAIVQTCEHIVHVDPIPSQTESNTHMKQVSLPRNASNSTSSILEIYASTKPYPEWWSMLDEPHLSQRRKSLGDSVLERNVCFVDTPGYQNGSSAMETIMSSVEYIESHLDKISSDSLSDSDMLNMLGGSGGFQVDVVFYFISQKMRPIDIEYIRRLTPLTNVIPLLAQADSLSLDQLAICKEQLIGQLQEAGLQTFSFALTTSDRSATAIPSIPYAVSSATGSDDDIMDASLLMSADYVQPLMTSELKYLVENVFSPSGISWLRHAAAKKYLGWRNTTPSRPRHLYRPLSLPGPTSSFLPSRSSENPTSPRASLALARLNDRQLAHNPPQMHMADWAADLQRSLASERAQYESLARGERAIWLTERLNECVQDGTLVALNKPQGTSSVGVRRPSKRRPSTTTVPHQDPLGLLQVAADLKAKGWVALEVIGSLGVIGGLAFWMSRQHWHMDPLELALADEWVRRWGVDI
ncbi:Septin-domain-containing protein [Daldinia loculata]|uniref:Septin-domain-containing protein n=1 Tax=Daldinia loculata TaxID=103429 RepID=UPI0020C466B2|nr:Septin-domain-containing protein [Daldinia loculata]KAI1648554.1 Septin-domain-containing protein [Daldinia loculata]